jgi:HAD superfamily hydrolase (TIGR01484 family)
MQPLADFPLAERARLRGVLCDIDDTLTTDGRLTADAYAALESLQRAGMLVVPVTGRPAGWCDHIARMWPVNAVVGENGAFYFRYDHAAHVMHRRFVDDDATRTDYRRKLAAIRDRILAAVPGCAVANDQHYRETDLAIDYCEDVPPLAENAVEKIAILMRQAGLTAKVSSIHVNGWFGDYDKLSMARTLLREKANSCSPAIRRTTRRCSRISRTRWASPTSGLSPAAWPTSPHTSRRPRAAPDFASWRITCSRRAD